MKKNIIYLHPHFTLPGGAGNFALQTAKRLSSDINNAIYIISGPQKNDIIKEYRLQNINFIEIKIPLTSSFLFWFLYPIWLLKIIFKLNELKNNLKGEVILFPQVFPANWWAFIYKILYKNTKIVFMCQEPSAFIHSKKWIKSINNPIKKNIATLLNPILKSIDLYLVSKSDYILVNSNFSKKSIEEVYGRADGIIYPGFDSGRFFIDDQVIKEKYIGVLSRLTKFKNVDFIIDLFAEFIKSFPDYMLRIGGEGEEKNNLMQRVKELGLENNIIFLGKISDADLPLFYQKAKAIFFASENEPFGMVPIEAMACGTLVIGNNSGGLKETIPDEFRYNDKEEALDMLKKIALSEKNFDFSFIDKFEWGNSTSKLNQYFNN